MAEELTPDELSNLMQGVHWEGPNYDERYKMFLEHRNGYVFLVVVGRVLQPLPHEFSIRIEKVFEKVPNAKVVIDLSSSALGFLVDFFNVSTSAGARVVILKPNDRVRAVIGLLGLDKFFSLVNSEQEAFDMLSTLFCTWPAKSP
jgi:anti-anti-sigma regulatory factor